jgi:uncharacterized phage protein (TIGR02218 family)
MARPEVTQAPVLVVAAPDAQTQVTQAPVLVVAAPEAPDAQTQVTQAPVLVLGEIIENEVRVTQAPVLVITGFDAQVRVTQAPALVLADWSPCFAQQATVWIITRTDGEVYGFTDHDQTLTFRGVSCKPCDSVSGSAVQLSAIVGQSGSVELRGILASGGVDEVELYSGLFDGAKLEVWLVPWGDNETGEIPRRLMGGTTGDSTQGEISFSQEILSDQQYLQQHALPETYTADCPYEFGNSNDSRCPVDLGPLVVSGSVTGLAVPDAMTNSTRRIFTDSTRVEADREFELGQITWTSGDNAGQTSFVKDFSGGAFVLWEPLFYPIEIGDGYDATPGCAKTKSAHLTYNADLVDFGGYPDIPGTDAFRRAPDAKE